MKDWYGKFSKVRRSLLAQPKPVPGSSAGLKLLRVYYKPQNSKLKIMHKFR
jgi:hypothetical protein